MYVCGMTIAEADAQLYQQICLLYENTEAATITDWVMESITQLKKQLRTQKNAIPLSSMEKALYEKYTTELQTHKPVQYVLNEAWFYRMKLFVNEQVLIPRPETEELAEWAIKDTKEQGIKTGSLLDIGTGSGCIALAIKKNLPLWEVYACDISNPALGIAQRNSRDLGLHIHFFQMDILHWQTDPEIPTLDSIISNPPYIPKKDSASMSNNVLLFEPALALFVEDNNPLLFYNAIADFAKKHLKEAGSVYLEIHEDLAVEVMALFKEKAYSKVMLRKDLQGRNRMIKLVK